MSAAWWPSGQSVGLATEKVTAGSNLGRSAFKLFTHMRLCHQAV